MSQVIKLSDKAANRIKSILSNDKDVNIFPELVNIISISFSEK